MEAGMKKRRLKFQPVFRLPLLMLVGAGKFAAMLEQSIASAAYCAIGTSLLQTRTKLE